MPLQRCCALPMLAVLSCLAHSGLGLNTRIALHRHVQKLSHGSAAYAVFAHHKAGTQLNGFLLYEMVRTLGFDWKEVSWDDVRLASEGHGSIECARNNTVTLYEDMRVPYLLQILQGCPDTRAVHLIRQPSSMLASNIVYDCQIEAGDEVPADVELGHRFREMPVPKMVEAQCHYTGYEYIQQMVDVHEYVQSHSLENIFEVHFEDFEEAYDNTTRSIFSHFLGSGAPSVDQLVNASVQYDRRRMPDSMVNNDRHISNETLKAQVKAEMQQQYAAGNSCQKRFWEWDKKLGYTYNVSSS